jgi:Kef-type K+ transport system membrane component KefB/mannitol/fructose-specific phosphotransferase system IIA component (Ntr-type)
MANLSHGEIAVFLLSIALLLGTARLFGEIARLMKQPALLGEIFAGVLLGPTVLGRINPDWFAMLFPETGGVAIALEAVFTLAIVLFLLVAGLEVDLSMAFRQGKAALGVSLVGIVIPFGIGFVAAYYIPTIFTHEESEQHFAFSLFFATALSITALPVIARILMDLNLFRTDLGMIVIAAAILNDLAGWMIFAVILGMIADSDKNILLVLGLTLALAIFLLTLGRWLLNKTLPWLQAHTDWPAGVMAFAMTGALLCASFTEYIGIHAIFGSFLFGVALGDSKHLRNRTRSTIEHFISHIFAPLFFASIGLKVDFLANFAPMLVIIVLVIATIGKVFGGYIGARVCGVPSRSSWAIGWAMNARGAMEIILGLLALQYNLIDEQMFVALVVMALVTSMTSGTAMQILLGTKKALQLPDLLQAKNYLRPLTGFSRHRAIEQLCDHLAKAQGIDAETLCASVLKREEVMPTGIGKGVAIPHGKIDDLKEPLVAVGIHPDGVDFDAPDGKLARLIFLIVTPKGAAEQQLDILRAISQSVSEEGVVQRMVQAKNYTEFLAVIRADERQMEHHEPTEEAAT